MKILITGGAGYIGSHTAKELSRCGCEPVVLDNLRHGHAWAVRWGPLEVVDLADRRSLDAVFDKHQFAAVIHFAAFAYVGESVQCPAEYFRNNVANTLNLLDAMRAHGVNRIVFSSTCATYGNPKRLPMGEDHPQEPVNPYGHSKLMVERILQSYERAYGLRWTALRYFNAAGADPEGEIGEYHDPETHLIPRAIAAACGETAELEVFGTDYDTADGTAIRDYIHVADLATAHVKALHRLAAGDPSVALNLGTGTGCSVKQVISAVEACSGRRVPVKLCPRREGDPPSLVADASRAAVELGWSPQHSLQDIVETAWRWHGGQAAVKTAAGIIKGGAQACRVSSLR